MPNMVVGLPQSWRWYPDRRYYRMMTEGMNLCDESSDFRRDAVRKKGGAMKWMNHPFANGGCDWILASDAGYYATNSYAPRQVMRTIGRLPTGRADIANRSVKRVAALEGRKR